jgi:hypothetical protein
MFYDQSTVVAKLPRNAEKGISTMNDCLAIWALALQC